MNQTLTAIVCSLWCVAPFLASRFIDLGYGVLPASVVLMTILYGILDVQHDLYGIESRKKTIIVGAIARFTTWLLIALISLLPVAKEAVGFEQIVLTSGKLMLWGEVAMFASQYFVDSWIYQAVAKRYSSFFMRYNVSTWTSQTVSLFVMAYFGFSHHMPTEIFIMAIAIRVGLTIAITPALILLRRFEHGKRTNNFT